MPVIVWVKADHREAAVQKSIRYLTTDARDNDVLGHTLPNDQPEANPGWHVAWKKGPPPEIIDEEYEFDTTTMKVRKIEHG